MAEYKTENYDLDNGRGDILSARLELPISGEPKAFSIFANCFTCEKDFFAPKRISRSLAERGIGTVRFDFTGLGESEGVFSDTNFTTNIQDMHAIAKKLRKDFGYYPEALLGHSFGGAAAIGLASVLGNDTVKTIATIGSPKDPRHVMRHFEQHEQILERDGKIEITVAGRTYILKKQFAEDVNSHDIEQKTRDFKGHLFVFHDPKDEMVDYSNAKDIFSRGGGVSHLVTLEGAGHMLGNIKYTKYVADVLADWILDSQEPEAEHITTRSAA